MRATVVVNLAVIGDPIEHSLSPLMHQAAYLELGLDWQYSRRHVRLGEFQTFFDQLDSTWLGLSVTAPHKLAALQSGNFIDAPASLSNASNTLYFDYQDGQRTVLAFNTDVPGLTNALKLHGLVDSSYWLFGAGATARSALIALKNLGVTEVNLLLRNAAKATDLVQLAKTLELSLTVYSPTRLPKVILGSILNTIPASVESAELSQALKLIDLANSKLYEVGYSPWPTHLAKQVLAGGGQAFSGISMLVEQAVLQLRIFLTGRLDQPLDTESRIRAAMISAIQNR